MSLPKQKNNPINLTSEIFFIHFFEKGLDFFRNYDRIYVTTKMEVTQDGIQDF